MLPSRTRESRLSNGSTPIADDAKSAARPGVPIAGSLADEVLASDECEERQVAVSKIEKAEAAVPDGRS